MTNPRYQQGCPGQLQEPGKNAARWVVNFNNGNVNDNNRNNNACVRAVRAGEYHGEGEVTLQALHTAWLAARKGKQPSRNQLSFDARWADNLIQLQELINTGRWQPRPSACFVAERPKAREIHAPDFADRVVHHWLVPQLEAIWEPRFIHDSYANRRGKGSHAAVERLQNFVRQVHSGQKGGWYLQLDIHNFFNSIHRPTLWQIVKRSLEKAKVPNTVLQITHALLRRHPLHPGVNHHSTQAERNLVPKHKRLENTGAACGLPIGNLSSQFFANVYLDKLDQFVKHTLKARRYLRYVDDFIIVHNNRQQLETWLGKIQTFIAQELRLSLKPDIRLKPLTDGIDFLGYVVRPTYTLVRKRVVAHAKETLGQWQQRHVTGNQITATPAELRNIQAVTASFHGHCRHANTHRLQAAMGQQFPWLNAATRRRKFHHQLEGRAIAIPVLASSPTTGFKL
ncbi:RNA-directed DNA polymerase [Marinobacter daepoensis]|uniref:RNA-directed DNA polymerase n=1 Tax=Marinobacter daepoensis TaxID=262077 RepID=UPI001C95119B|nr:RNA-directed DNA polymerase [Marinobacter daepoensis]MBY6032153.1 RNA-directed DNA polymerase [Marinobacter daepoensis]